MRYRRRYRLLGRQRYPAVQSRQAVVRAHRIHPPNSADVHAPHTPILLARACLPCRPDCPGPCVLQVSHHPPIGAGHAETDLWSYDLVSAPKTKFLGNSVEVYPIGEA